MKDKHFLCINLLLDSNLGIRNYNRHELLNLSLSSLIEMSNIQIGILFRKATSGIKSVLKLYKANNFSNNAHLSTIKMMNMKDNDNIDETIEKMSGQNINTLSMRIELYTKENIFKNLNLETKEYLFTYMSLIEETIGKMILDWNEYRSAMHVLTKESKVREFINLNPYFTFKNEISDILQDNETDLQTNNENKKDKNLYNINLENFNLNFQESTADLKNKFTNINIGFADKLNLISSLTFNTLPLPTYIISTRDCFVFDLIVKEETITIKGRNYLKKEYFFNRDNVPSNFYKFKTDLNDFRVGVVTYENFFTDAELKKAEKNVEKTEKLSLMDAFLPETAQKTFSGEKIKRTKFFFGSRYMWTKKQLAEPNSYVGAGIRKDVSPAPFWIKEDLESHLIDHNIIEKDFINSYAMNVYHDGSEGLAQHFDDAVRFKQVNISYYFFSQFLQ